MKNGAKSQEFWNTWNAQHRADEDALGDVSDRQLEVLRLWLAGRQNASILDAGCGSGWASAHLAEFGSVVGTDLADESIERARARWPHIRFVAGDIMSVDVGTDFDVVVSLEVLSHVADQRALMGRCFDWLRPGGELMLATQNRPVLARFNRVPPPDPAQIRNWVDRRELCRLVIDAGFRIDTVRAVSPKANRWPMRAVAKLGRITRTSSWLERAGFGWTLMVRATKPA